MQRSFDWSGHHTWKIRVTGLTGYIGTCKGHLTNQDIPSKKTDALDSPTMLEHAKVIWLIKTLLLRNQRHWTHRLCWNMQRSFDWSEHSSWEIRGTRLTGYVEVCKGALINQDILPEKSDALDSLTMSEYAKVIWLIRTLLLTNQRHWTHRLYWNMQRSFDQSGHPSWEITGTGLTSYIGACKGHLINQDIPLEKSEALDSPAILEHVKVIWLIRTSTLKSQMH
jgi:hypothetical protein